MLVRLKYAREDTFYDDKRLEGNVFQVFEIQGLQNLYFLLLGSLRESLGTPLPLLKEDCEVIDVKEERGITL